MYPGVLHYRHPGFKLGYGVVAMTKAYFYDNTPVELDVDAETLWVLYSWVKRGGAEVRVMCGIGKRRIWLGLQHINAEKTFSEAILAAHGDTDPPSQGVVNDPSLPPPPPLPRGLSKRTGSSGTFAAVRDTERVEDGKTPVP